MNIAQLRAAVQAAALRVTAANTAIAAVPAGQPIPANLQAELTAAQAEQTQADAAFNAAFAAPVPPAPARRNRFWAWLARFWWIPATAVVLLAAYWLISWTPSVNPVLEADARIARIERKFAEQRTADQAEAKRALDAAEAKRISDLAEAKRLTDAADAKRLSDAADEQQRIAAAKAVTPSPAFQKKQEILSGELMAYKASDIFAFEPAAGGQFIPTGITLVGKKFRQFRQLGQTSLREEFAVTLGPDDYVVSSQTGSTKVGKVTMFTEQITGFIVGGVEYSVVSPGMWVSGELNNIKSPVSHRLVDLVLHRGVMPAEKLKVVRANLLASRRAVPANTGTGGEGKATKKG